MSRKISSGAISLFLLLLAAGADAGTGAFSGGTPARIDLSICFTYPEGDPDAWRPVFNEASKLLYNATKKQVQLGRIRVFLNCPAKKEEAGILIRRGDSPASAHLLGLGAKGTHIFLSEKHKSAAGAAQGQFGIVPALGRHVFGLHPESQGRKRFIRLPGGTPLMTPAVDFFCPGCLMDGGTTVFPRQPEFCTNRSMGFTTSHEGGYVRSRIRLVFPELGTVDFGELYQTEQQIRNGKSAWETMIQVAGQRYGILLRPPEREPVDDAAGHADLVNGETWVVESCASKTLLVIDASSSMAGLRMELAQMAAKDSVALTESGNYLGVVSFATEATVNFPLQPLLDSSSRSAAQVAIDGIATGGWTSIGGALRAALNQILESPRTANESIILLTEGDHNAGEPPSEVIPDLVSAGVKVRSIALGPEANVTLLSQISQATGGTVEYASQAEQIIGIMTRLTTASAGNFPVKTVRGSIAPGGQASSTVLVDSFQQGAVFSLSWSAGILEVVLQRPDGSVVGPGDSGVEHLASASSEFYRILQPAQGTWRCTVRAVNLSAPQNYTLQVLDRSLGVQITARAGNDPVAYPEAVQIQAYVVADGYPVAGAAVEAVITRPDGIEVAIPLYDDGVAGHGDQEKSDGIYTNYFARYGGNGLHSIRLQVVNQNGISVRPQEKDSSFRPWPIAPFERESSLSFMVTNASVITPSTGVTLASRPQSPYPDLTAPPAVSDWIVLAFSLTVDPQESVLIRSLTTTGLALGNRIPTSGLKLYIDGDRDGFIDASGLFALPVATGSYDPGTGRAVFSDPVLLWSGTSTNFILTLDFTSPPSPSLWAYRGRLAVMFFGPFLATVLGFRRKTGGLLPVIAAVFLVAALALVSCGGSGGGGSAGGGEVTAEVHAAVSPADISAIGASTGWAISVGGDTIRGPKLALQPAP